MVGFILLHTMEEYPKYETRLGDRTYGRLDGLMFDVLYSSCNIEVLNYIVNTVRSPFRQIVFHDPLSDRTFIPD